MRTALLALAAICTGVTASSLSKVTPPPADRGAPAFLIFQDVDNVDMRNGNMTSCPSVKALRSKCYKEGIDQKSYFAEQQCLCNPDTAYQVVQCFAKQYSLLTESSAKDSYYEDFLTYTYDCYCGVTKYDVTYNISADPPMPYIPGFTGDAILPPTGGCPATQPPSADQVCPKPPCNCAPPVKPPRPACPTGYHRVYDCCVPVVSPTPSCEEPKEIDHTGQCSCPYGFLPVGSNGCEIPGCDIAGQERVITPHGSYCTCQAGYELWNNQCKPTCQQGQQHDTTSGNCESICTSPEISNYNGTCICPVDYGYELVNNVCREIECSTSNWSWNDLQGCGCHAPNYVDSNGACQVPLCNQPGPSCYPSYPTSLFPTVTVSSPVTIMYNSSAPAYTPYTTTTVYNTSAYTDTSTQAVPTSTPSMMTTDGIIVTNGTAHFGPAPTDSSSSSDDGIIVTNGTPHFGPAPTDSSSSSSDAESSSTDGIIVTNGTPHFGPAPTASSSSSDDGIIVTNGTPHFGPAPTASSSSSSSGDGIIVTNGTPHFGPAPTKRHVRQWL